jgi:hypothetical protein
VLRVIAWRVLAVVAAVLAVRLAADLLHGSIGRSLRGGAGRVAGRVPHLPRPDPPLGVEAPSWLWPALAAPAVTIAGIALLSTIARTVSRRRRRYVRLRVVPYATDHADAYALARMYAALHAALVERWWRRVVRGQPSAALEVWFEGSGTGRGGAWLAVTCPAGRAPALEPVLRTAYPNARLAETDRDARPPAVLLRLRKHAGFIRRTATAERFERDPEPAVDGLLRAMSGTPGPALVQIALTPAPAGVERLAKLLFKQREAELSRRRREHLVIRDRSMVEDAELRGGLEVQHRSLFFADLRILAPGRGDCERIGAALRARRAENRLVERGAELRHGRLGLWARRLRRGEGNPLPGLWHHLLAPAELAELWQLPSVDFAAVPVARSSLPLAPAPPSVMRPGAGRGTLRDSLGPVSIHAGLRRQNVAVPGTVDQGKSSFLVASVAEDMRRERCAVIVLDPKGDAAEAALSAVPRGRVCTLLDLADPTCGFNPLRVDAPADVIADYVVEALKNLFDQSDIRASSDRYLRNAVIAVLAHDRAGTLWDAARLLSVGEEGYAYRRAVGAAVRSLPELKEISSFFTSELSAQLADARSATTAKLDAPVNKLARLLNSPSIKRVLLNESLRVDFDRVIARGEVLVVKGALGSMGAGNTSVLMQLLVGMLDAALARQQDLVAAGDRIAVALKVDEAPLVLNRGFAETMALKRSAGLETVACWQTDAQWTEREVRDQLDALFAHRVWFATASARDARASAQLAMAEFSDTVRPGIARLSALGHPEVRLRLPRHHAIVSLVTPDGRAPAFIAETVPMRVDRARIAELAAEQAARGARRMTDLRQPHWERPESGREGVARPPAAGARGAPSSAAPAHPEVPSRLGAVAPARTTLASSDAPPPLPSTVAQSFRELLDLDRARAARAVRRAGPGSAIELDPSDLEALSLLAALGHVLSSDVHRRLAPARAPTRTQRRLKRLADAGLIERLQFHRPDGGGVPMCCSIAPAGLAALEAHEIELPAAAGATPERDGALRQVRHEAHVAAWVIALAGLCDSMGLRGRAGSVLAVPRSPSGPGRPLGPQELRLPGGRVPHDFLRTSGPGRVETERFDTLRPDATVSMRRAGRKLLDLMVERDDRLAAPAWVSKLERYDHFLAGWSTHTSRYGPRGAAQAIVVFVCRDRARARECARRADSLLVACRAYAGDYPQSWEYPSRGGIVFAAERDVHEGVLHAWATPELPPLVRASLADGDPAAGEARAVGVTILPEPARGA